MTEINIGSETDGVWKFYRAAPVRRTLGRWMAVISALLIVFLATATVLNLLRRVEKGIPLRYSGFIMLVAPLMLLVIGIWLGWGQTRIDLRRRTVEIRPFGSPFPARIHQFGGPDYLSVVRIPGVRASYMPYPPGAIISPKEYWHVRLEAAGFSAPLKVQIGSRSEALALAESLSTETGLPVQAPEP